MVGSAPRSLDDENGTKLTKGMGFEMTTTISCHGKRYAVALDPTRKKTVNNLRSSSIW